MLSPWEEERGGYKGMDGERLGKDTQETMMSAIIFFIYIPPNIMYFNIKIYKYKNIKIHKSCIL